MSQSSNQSKSNTGASSLNRSNPLSYSFEEKINSKDIMKLNSLPNYSSKDTPFFRSNASLNMSLSNRDLKNPLKQSSLPKQIEIRPKFEKFKISNLGKFKTQERKDEV